MVGAGEFCEVIYTSCHEVAGSAKGVWFRGALNEARREERRLVVVQFSGNLRPNLRMTNAQ